MDFPVVIGVVVAWTVLSVPFSLALGAVLGSTPEPEAEAICVSGGNVAARLAKAANFAADF